MDDHLKRLVRYGVVGAVVNLMLLAAFAALVTTQIAAVSATIIVYIVGVGVSYVLNRNWAFSSGRRHVSGLPAYILAYACGGLAAAALMWIFHNHLGFPAIMVQAVAMVVVPVLIFTLLNWLVFPRGKEAD